MLDKNRNFGQRSQLKIPRVNIGAMRLPKDIDEAVELIRFAIDNGLTYIDTSRGYGESELKLGKALKDGYREKVILSTKWAPWIVKIEDDDNASADCVLKRIDESMKRLDVEYLDFFQVWNIINRDAYNEAVKKGGFVDGIKTAMHRGMVRHTGFTSHDSVENLLEYIEEAEWCEVLLLSFNILNRRYQKVLEKAHEKGIGTIVMNPVGGGKLSQNSSVFQSLVEEVGAENLTDLAVRWILSHSCVDTIISGISKKTDITSVIQHSKKEPFTLDQISTINKFVDSLLKTKVEFCTACKYCLPCPEEIVIPRVMDAIYHHRYLGFTEEAEKIYSKIGNQWNVGKNASFCTECGSCIPKCTQQINIPKEMQYAKEIWA